LKFTQKNIVEKEKLNKRKKVNFKVFHIAFCLYNEEKLLTFYLAHAFIVEYQIFRVQLTVCKRENQVKKMKNEKLFIRDERKVFDFFLFTFSAHLNTFQRMS
jgi:hypothetical protein